MLKIFKIIVVIGSVVVTYWVMAAMQPFTNSVVATTNASINGTLFPETVAAINAWPLYSWFIPLVVGAVAVAVILKSG